MGLRNVVDFPPSASCSLPEESRGLGDGTRARGGNASPEDLPRTPLVKEHGPEGGSQPKAVTWEPTGSVMQMRSAFNVGGMLALFWRPPTWVRAEPNLANGNELGVTPRIVTWCEILGRAEVVVGHVVQQIHR